MLFVPAGGVPKYADEVDNVHVRGKAKYILVKGEHQDRLFVNQ